MKTCKRCGENKPSESFSKKLKGWQPNCKVCSGALQRVWREANRERELGRARRRYLEQRDALLAKQKAYYAANREARLQYAGVWREANPCYSANLYAANAEQQREASRRWKQQNPAHARMLEKTRRSASRRIPAWSDRKLMADVYHYARIMRAAGVDCHVDHVVPLRGKTVCGLHTHDNLTVLLAEDNLRKGARLT